jgi:hypothetical protein
MHYDRRHSRNTDDVHCSDCGTRLNRGGYTICPACGNDNYIWIDNKRRMDSFFYEISLEEKAKKAGFDSKAEHYIWMDKISKIEDYEKARIKFIEKYIYPIALAIISLISSICIIPNWWLIFQLILFVIIYLLLKFIIDDLIEPFDSLQYNIYKKYSDIKEDSSLLKDNNKLKNSIPKINKEEVISEFNLPSIKNIEGNKNLEKSSTKQIAEVINLNGVISLEFEPYINQNQIEQIRAFVKTISNNNSKKTVINGEGKNIRNLDYKEVKLLIEFLETLSIYTKNKKKYN